MFISVKTKKGTIGCVAGRRADDSLVGCRKTGTLNASYFVEDAHFMRNIRNSVRDARSVLDISMVEIQVTRKCYAEPNRVRVNPSLFI